jgi:hypothetical protein
VKPRVLLEAELETVEAALRYDREQAGLGAEFLGEVDAAMKLVEDNPLKHALYEAIPDNDAYRRVLVKRFPYSVIYTVRPDEVLVVAVAHASRHPGYWLQRVRFSPGKQ